ncbi:DUF7009 family protein [Oleiagrimonas soli]|uniref:Uncharacterized protein n=1 Tax=Oleiagrimonas soli TaxID=1543381 RepID=A0A099CZL5_9GAMM|nr:hypothetical protein [Oleiagrimonas soli]KGI79121.1 hypothetical protein LF63_0101210 [Oleiagrimonas soli]MBB6184644.1 hypothetical protein [Oleiagrimonas soli]
MRVQLQAQSLRIRLQEDEFAQLRAGETVENRSALPHGHVAVQRVRAGEDAQPDWRLDGDAWVLIVPRTMLDAYAERLPTRDGLSLRFDTPDGHALDVLFDVDVRDSARARLPKR